MSPRAARAWRPGDHVEGWKGGSRPYDIAKEGAIALVVVSLLTVGLSVLFGSPDDPPVTIRSWSQAAPQDFVMAALSELSYSSEVAGYGPPYTSDNSAGQKVGPICLQCIPGVRLPIDTAQAFVIGPLRTDANDAPELAAALDAYTSATPTQQTAWTDAYAKVLANTAITPGTLTLPSGPNFGPVAAMMQEELRLAQGGGLDGVLLQTRQFYQTDYTKAILFISAGTYFEDQASAKHLLGTQWGMMNETGGWPGQAWLWLYTFWYQVPPFSTSGNADALIWVIMAALTLVLILVPFIPGVRSLPYRLKLYRLIWRDYYRSIERS